MIGLLIDWLALILSIIIIGAGIYYSLPFPIFVGILGMVTACYGIFR